MAFEGDAALADAANGKLTAVFHTSMGDFECELFEEKAPLTVANFVGLVR
ncbi:MAG: peptidylprolyl isomerase, partial [Myxococcales bacterium]|nr:peptidylprolyl isomerase [Myxococcales bacterium]